VAEVENELKKNMVENSSQSQADNETTSNEVSNPNSPKPTSKSYSSNVLNISQHLENFVDGITKSAKV